MSVALAPTKHSAPGQYLGFALQPVRFCYHLLSCPPGASVSIEYLDDVAVHYANGAVLLEQTKSALKQNPVSDWADDLWKIFVNWLNACRKGHIIAENSLFRMYVTPIRSGSRVLSFSNATSADEVEAAIAGLKSAITDLKKLPADDSFVAIFANTKPTEQFAILSRFKLISEDEDPLEPIRALYSLTVEPNVIDLICHYAIGAAKEADELIRRGLPPLISGDYFKGKVRAFVQRHNLPGMLIARAAVPPAGDIDRTIQERPVFIRQLELIDAPDEQRMRAVRDYLRASADKAWWAADGLLFKEQLDDWDDDLVGATASSAVNLPICTRTGRQRFAVA